MPPAPTPPGPTPTATGSEFRLSWIDHPALPAHGLGLCRCPGSRDGVRVPPSLLAQDLGHLAGLGRSGLLAAALLVWRGVAADEAIAAIRRCRPGAIETEGQERYIRSLA